MPSTKTATATKRTKAAPATASTSTQSAAAPADDPRIRALEGEVAKLRGVVLTLCQHVTGQASAGEVDTARQALDQ